MKVNTKLLQWIGDTVKKKMIPEAGRVVSVGKRNCCGHTNCIVCLQTSSDGLWIVSDNGDSFSVWQWNRVSSLVTREYTEEALLKTFIQAYRDQLTVFDLLIAGELLNE